MYDEVRRVLAPNGYLVVTETDDRFKLPFVSQAVAFRRWRAEPGLNPRELRRRIEAAGFTLVKARRFYGLLARLGYTVLFFIRPPRGARARWWLWERAVAVDARFPFRAQASLLVAQITE
jgi:hypothetical protein